MPAHRTRGASTSRKSEDVSDGIKFCMEKGETYRPFTDPERIAKNDAKKSCKNDARAKVIGVPDKYLGVLEVGTQACSIASDYQNPGRETPGDNPTGHFPSTPSMTSPRQSTFHGDVCESNTYDGVYHQDLPGATHSSSVDDTPLWVHIPSFLPEESCTNASSVSNCYSAVTSSPGDGGYHQSCTGLHLPSDQISLCDNSHEVPGPEFPGFNNGQILNNDFEHHQLWSPSSLDTLDLDSTRGTPESISILDPSEFPTPQGVEPEVYKEQLFASFDSNGAPLNSDSIPIADFALECLSGSSTISQTDHSGTSDHYDILMAEQTQKIVQHLHFTQDDLECLSPSHEEKPRAFSVVGNPNALLSSGSIVS